MACGSSKPGYPSVFYSCLGVLWQLPVTFHSSRSPTLQKCYAAAPCGTLNKLSSSNTLCPWWRVHSLCAGLFDVNLTQAKVTWEEEASTKKRSPWDQAVGQPVRYFLNDWWSRVRPIVGDAISGLVALGSISRLSKQWGVRRWVALLRGLSTGSCLKVPPLFEFPPWLPLMMNSTVEKQAKWTLSSPTCFWSRCFITAIATLTNTVWDKNISIKFAFQHSNAQS